MVRVDPTRGLAWPRREGSSPCRVGMLCAQWAKRSGIDSRGGEGIRGRCKMLLSSLAPPGKLDVASRVEGGGGVPPRVCRGEWLPILATSPELSHGAQQSPLLKPQRPGAQAPSGWLSASLPQTGAGHLLVLILSFTFSPPGCSLFGA